MAPGMGERARRRLREHWDLRHPEPPGAYDNLDDEGVDPDLLDDVDHESVGRSCMWAVALWKALRARRAGAAARAAARPPARWEIAPDDGRCHPSRSSG